MTRTTALYVLTGLAAVLAGLVVPYLVHRTGGTSVPGWQGLVMPGALTDKHRFITQRCETCHTPHIGVEARNCIACHANSPAILSKQSTSFHASIGTCDPPPCEWSALWYGLWAKTRTDEWERSGTSLRM